MNIIAYYMKILNNEFKKYHYGKTYKKLVNNIKLNKFHLKLYFLLLADWVRTVNSWYLLKQRCVIKIMLNMKIQFLKNL